MKKPEQHPEPIELAINLPPDGTHPPRIVFPENSMWLYEGAEAVEVTRGVFAKNIEGKCIIFPISNTKLKVNNQSIMLRRTLIDGDLIHEESLLRGIFQADPVADYRAFIEKESAEPITTIQISKRLYNQVVINDRGMSLDAGKHFAEWNKIKVLDVNVSEHRFQISIRVSNSSVKGKQLPSSFVSKPGVFEVINGLRKSLVVSLNRVVRYRNSHK